MDTTNKIPGVIALLKKTLLSYRKNIKDISLIALVPISLSIVELLVNKILFANTILYLVVAVLFAVMTVVVQSIYAIAVIKKIYHIDTNQSSTLREIYTSSLKLFLPYLLLNIIFMSVIIGSTFLLIIPGIAVSIYISFSFYSLVVDDRRGFKALSNSTYYVRDNWWAVFGRLIGLAVMFSIIALLLLAVIYMVMRINNYDISGIANFINILNSNNNLNILAVITRLLPQIFSFFVFIPISIIYSYFIYKSLKMNKSEPNPETDSKKNRKMYIALFILGIIAYISLLIILMNFMPANKRTINTNRNIATETVLLITKSDLLEKNPYINKAYSYTINLPLGWNDIKDDGKTVMIVQKGNNDDSAMNISSEAINDNYRDITLDKAIPLIAGNLQNSGIKNIEYSKVKTPYVDMYDISGKFYLSDNSSMIVHYYYSMNNGRLYVIGIAISSSLEEKYSEALLSSVSTFQFKNEK